MDKFETTLGHFQGVLASFRFTEAQSFPEEFAQKRYLKKMERPDRNRHVERRQQAWERWLQTDLSLPTRVALPSGEWYRARQLIHHWLKHFRLADIETLPSGSEFFPTKGANSIEAKLANSRWSVTPDCVEMFFNAVMECRALKVAFRKRYTRWFQRFFPDESQAMSDRYLYRRLHIDMGLPVRDIAFWKFQRIITVVHGSRFTTVPKNNEKDRSINIEPIGNLIVQRRIGIGLRDCLSHFGYVLQEIPELHHRRISNPDIATVDLSDASDSVSLALCRFLLPERVMRLCEQSRAPMTLGLDREYHVPRKISSMGNGFTFELESLIFLALCRVMDKSATVFGDDMIIQSSQAERLISLLHEVGFRVNREKSFITGPFRESCGANFHSDFGYIRSFDFKYPVDIHDCVICYNKAALLALTYPSFERLRATLRPYIPRSLTGGPCYTGHETAGLHGKVRDFNQPDPELSNYFRTGVDTAVHDHRLEKIGRAVAHRYGYPASKVQAFMGLTYHPTLRSRSWRSLRSTQWAKYLMYLHAGRVSRDELTGAGSWVTKTYVWVDGAVIPWRRSLTHT